MSETIRETLARALWENETDCIGGSCPWDQAGEFSKEARRKEAAGVLARLRAAGLEIVPLEPSEAMLEAAQRVELAGGMLRLTRDKAAEIHRAMLKASSHE